MAKTRERIDAARTWYIQGLIPTAGDTPELRQPSLDDVSERSGVSLSTLQRRSRDEGWVEQRNAFAKSTAEAENKRLIQSLGDQHARTRAAYFRSSIRLQTTIERKLTHEGESLGMTDLSAAASALAKAQKVTDTALLGAETLEQQEAQVLPKPVTGWLAISGPPPPDVEAMLASLDREGLVRSSPFGIQQWHPNGS